MKLVNSEGLIKTSDVFVEREKELVIDDPLIHYSEVVIKINARKKLQGIILKPH